jgi:hypothetical protein
MTMLFRPARVTTPDPHRHGFQEPPAFGGSRAKPWWGIAGKAFLAAFLAAAPAMAETQAPAPATSQTLAPPSGPAVPRPGTTVLGIQIPPLPELPSLPEMINTVGALPERIGLPNANHVIDAQFDRLVQKLNLAIPAIETLGFEVRNFEVDWTMPPQIRVRLQSSETVTDEEYAFVLAGVKGDLILESIILSLGSVHKIQRAANLAPFQRAQLEVDLTIPPRVVMTFTDPTNKFHDRFVEHHEALQKAMAEAKLRAPTAGPPPPTGPDGIPLPPP